jgi:hypothetical protein
MEADRFWMKVNKQAPNGCWEWTGARAGKEQRYAQTRHDGKHVLVHRLVMGEPDGLVLHHCDNPICVNPDHLYVGTYADNVRDMMERGRNVPPVGEKNGQAKITEEIAAQIVAMYKNGMKPAKIAKMLGLGYYTVQNITRGRTWKHLSIKT